MELSIIIVSFNTSKLLDQCLSSLKESVISDGLQDKTEIIVIDNNSKDGSVEMVQKKYPHVVLIQNKDNLGFSRANNQGIIKAAGEKIMLLNSDTQLRKKSLKSLLNLLDSSRIIGVIGPKILNTDRTLQYSTGYFPTLSKVFCWMWFLDDVWLINRYIKAYHMENDVFYKKNRYVDWVTGAALLFKKKITEKAGLLDEKIFMYGEEVEWCYRIKKTGYQIIYSPIISVFHYKGSSGEGKTAGIMEEFKAIVYFYQKHLPSWQMPILRFLLISGALLRIILFGIIHLNPKQISKYAKAIQLVG